MSNVNTHHSAYDRMADRWLRCRDVVEGQDAVFAAGTRYLPRLKLQTDDDYKAYQMRALFFNATWRTVSALSGLIFRKPPAIEAPKAVLPMFDDITLSGVSLYVFSQQCVLETLITGRVGVLVDYPPVEAVGITEAEAQRLNLRPFMAVYPAESIINWKVGTVDNQHVLTQVVLAEPFTKQKNEFEEETETHYRVLDLTAEGYRVRVFRIDDKNEDVQIGADTYPLMNGKRMSRIPFYFIGVDNTTPEVDSPPLLDLANANLAHYRLDADLKHGLHFTGLPQPVISGYVKDDNTKLYIGSPLAWVFPDPAARAYYLEFSGQGLASISQEKDKIEQLMAVLGARLLTQEKKATETAQAAAIHRAGENSILAAIALTVSASLTQALKLLCQWAGITEEPEPKITLNTEYFPPEMSAQDLAALVSAWQQGAISMQVLFEKLQKTEVVSSSLTLEEMQAQIEASPIPRPKPKGEGA